MSATLTELREQCQPKGSFPPGYYDRMVHKVPEAAVVNREDFILEKCRDRVVLSLGHSGPMADRMDEVCAKCYGVGLEPRNAGPYSVVDLDDLDGAEPGQTWGLGADLFFASVELVVVGEILEHLANPGRLLDALHRIYHCPLLITVPNAFASCHGEYTRKGFENVNKEHVAYYSYWTLKGLVERYDYKVDEWYWYNGKPLTAEGLIFMVS
jgi:hypothetical protein